MVAIAPLFRGLPIKLLFAVCLLALFALIVWRLALSREERFGVYRAIWGVSCEEV